MNKTSIFVKESLIDTLQISKTISWLWNYIETQRIQTEMPLKDLESLIDMNK